MIQNQNSAATATIISLVVSDKGKKPFVLYIALIH